MSGLSPVRQAIVKEALSWEGVKYRHQGRNRGSGIDCGGFLVVVAKALGLSDADLQAYHRYPDGPSLHKFLCEHLRLKCWGDAKPGDVVEMRDIATRWPCHVGILLPGQHGGLDIIHAWAKLCFRRVVRSSFDESWKDRMVAVFAFPGVDD